MLRDTGRSSGASSSASPSASPVLSAEAAALEWLDDASPTRLRAPLRIRVVRPLIPEDFEDVPTPTPPPSLRELKASHHHLAKLLADGRTTEDASRITGYSTGYISRLRGDASFAELITHYTTVEELAAVDYLGAMRAAGMDALDLLRRRMEDDPGSLTNGQLSDAVKLLLVEPMKSEALRGCVTAGGPALRISFVPAEQT